MTQEKINALYERIRAICLALPEVKEVEAWGHPTFRAPKKMFAAFGAELTGEPTLGLKVGFERQDELLEDPRFIPTPYAAHQGWVSLKLQSRMDWKEVSGLVEEAYRQVALKGLIKLLDQK
jgi:predicted DNA-binding protein (MmcQ/YjbR family)